MKRIASIDIVRGIVMIIMALDHVRDLLHTTSISQSATDLNTTTPLLFFTRWVTHLCAPVFVFLAGTSAFISYSHLKNQGESQKFLLTRGIWLIILEFSLVNFGLWFDIHFGLFLFEVIAAIGFGFIVMSRMLGWSPKVIGLTGLCIIFGHNLIPLIPVDATSVFNRSWMTLFVPSAFPLGEGRTLVVGYAPVPWLGIMLAGFGAGSWFQLELLERKRIFLKTGLSAVALFFVIRLINIYGDSVAWQMQKDGLFTILSFLNLTKYPPSLDFCLLFLGIMFLILAAVEGMQNRLTRIAAVYGKAPLFYFLIHWYIIHPILFAMVFLQGFKASDLVFGFNLGRPKEGSGVELWAIYLIWIGLVMILYPLCNWFWKYKESHRHILWMRYF